MNLQALETPYLLPTPGGAYYAATEHDDNIAKSVMLRLMSLETTPMASKESLEWLFSEVSDEQREDCLDALYEKKLVQGLDKPHSVRKGKLETILPEIISPLSNKGRALIADSQGFCLSSVGFDESLIEEISVLSADIADLHQRRVISLYTKLNLDSSAWAIINASGNSKLGFWPLQINKEIFVLAIEGVPYLNQPILTELVWILFFRYGINFNNGEK